MCSCSLGHALRSTKIAATRLAVARPHDLTGQENRQSGAAARKEVSEYPYTLRACGRTTRQAVVLVQKLSTNNRARDKRRRRKQAAGGGEARAGKEEAHMYHTNQTIHVVILLVGLSLGTAGLLLRASVISGCKLRAAGFCSRETARCSKDGNPIFSPNSRPAGSNG